MIQHVTFSVDYCMVSSFITFQAFLNMPGTKAAVQPGIKTYYNTLKWHQTGLQCHLSLNSELDRLMNATLSKKVSFYESFNERSVLRVSSAKLRKTTTQSESEICFLPSHKETTTSLKRNSGVPQGFI